MSSIENESSFMNFPFYSATLRSSRAAYECLFAFQVPRMYYMQRVRRTTREAAGRDVGVTKQRECLV